MCIVWEREKVDVVFKKTIFNYFVPVVGAEPGGFHRSGEWGGSAAPVTVLSSHCEHVLGVRPEWMDEWINECMKLTN